MLNPRKRMRQITKHAFSNIHANSGIEMTIWPWDILVPVRYLNLRVIFVAMATAGQIWLGLWFLWSTYMANYIYNIHFRVLPLVTVFVFPLPPPLNTFLDLGRWARSNPDHFSNENKGVSCGSLYSKHKLEKCVGRMIKLNQMFHQFGNGGHGNGGHILTQCYLVATALSRIPQ